MPRIVLIVLAVSLLVLLTVVLVFLLPGSARVAPVVPEAPSLRPQLVVDPGVIAGPPKVKLALMVVIDQLRGDYLPRWRVHLPPGGFRRLMDEGVWYSQCRYPYATTTTGPGHASMLTGTTPQRHGIIDNEWYDRANGRKVYCAAAPGFELVRQNQPPDPSSERQAKVKRRGAPTPARLLVPTVGDQLKVSGRGRVIGLSLKDRGAVLLAGQHADEAYWFDGEFVTSTYYRSELPDWVRTFNAGRPQDRWFGQQWDRLRPDLDYAAIAGPDAAPGEANRAGLGTVFPHPLTGNGSQITESYFEALTTSPHGDDLLLEFAKHCITSSRLGKADAPDLLCVSFSAFDYIGHAFGPDSQEVFDAFLRADRRLADLLGFLDEHAGPGQYALVLCSDHGVAPLIEASRARNLPAMKVSPARLQAEMERFLAERIGPASGTAPEPDDPFAGQPNRWIEFFEAPNVYLNHELIRRQQRSVDDVAAELAAWLQARPEVERVYRASQLQPRTEADPIDRAAMLSFHAERSGDLYILLKPFSFFSPESYTGTTHGTPYEYDRHVPLLVFGPGVVRGERTEARSPCHAAAILADFLGLKPPRDALPLDRAD